MKKYIWVNKHILCLTVIFSVLATMFGVGVQFLKGNILDIAVSGNLNKLINYALLLVIFVLSECLLNYFFNQSRMKYAICCSKLLRLDYFQSILNRNVKKFKSKNTSDYVTKFSNDLELLKNMYFTNMTLLIHLILKVIIVSISLFILDWKIAVITILLLTMPLYVPKLVEKKLVKAQNEYLKSIETNLNSITDWFSKFETIKMFSIEKKINEKFLESNNEVIQSNLREKKVNNITQLLTSLMSYFSHIIILLVAAYFVYQKDFSVGSFIVAVGMIDQLSYPIISISSSYQNLISVKDISKRVLNEIENFKSRNYEDEGISIKSDFQFKNVSFKYDSQDELISNLSFSFEKGKKYLIRGKSGSGKTTLIDLLLNYQTAKSGEIYYDNNKIDEVEPFRYVTVIRQSPELFDDTIRNNLTLYSKKYSDEDILKVLKAVNLNKFINSQGLNLGVGENGSKLSGGEGKRICFARALLRDRDVLIFDEPLANLDQNSVETIEDILLSFTGKTVIVISHTFTDDKLSKFDGILDLGQI